MICAQEGCCAGSDLQIYDFIANEGDHTVVIVESVLAKHRARMRARVPAERVVDVGDKGWGGGHEASSKLKMIVRKR